MNTDGSVRVMSRVQRHTSAITHFEIKEENKRSTGRGVFWYDVPLFFLVNPGRRGSKNAIFVYYKEEQKRNV